MDVEKETKQLKEQQQRVVAPICCCWPRGTAARTFWGGALLLVGTVWLLDSIGLAAALLWPLLFIGLGLFLLLRWARERHA
jgi:hypothetical protein